ncbi:hypothetical protein [Nocardioides alkalitolerans]|uniref:hypothetical protein n=1 Tax=Nocardioides alkalitolerans TaxID=281714 RepID=UPI0003F85435|nr:hypothetical protein [Nocardioides alkalitolerans]
MSWTDPGPSSLAPTVVVDLGAPLGVRNVTSYDIEHELQGGTLTAATRARSGYSVGAASITIAVDPMSKVPWSKGADRLRAGGDATLRAECPGLEPFPLGAWVVAPVSGSLTKVGRTVTLREKQYAGRKVANLLPALADNDADPAWMIDTLARQCGFWSTPAPVESCVLSLPLNGAVWAEVGKDAYPSTSPARWGALGGVVGPTGGPWGAEAGFTPGSEWGSTQGFTWRLSRALLHSGTSLYVTGTFDGTASLRFPSSSVQVEIRADIGQVAVRGHSSQPWATTSYMPGLDPRHPQRVQLEIQRDGTVTDPMTDTNSGTFGPTRVRARSAHGTAWSPWAVDVSTRSDYIARSMWIEGPADATAGGVQCTLAADPALWAPVTADIDPLGGVVTAPWLPGDLDPWSGIQQVAEKWLAGVWPTRDGVLVGRDRHYLAGGTPVVETIDVGRRVEDLPWTIDPANAADRLEVTWSPPDVVETSYETEVFESPELWSADEAIRLNPGQVVERVVDLDRLGFINEFSQWRPVWQSPHLTSPTWDARFQRGGGGGQVPADALAISTRQVSAGRLIIRIRNQTNSVLWTVDAEGKPALVQRGYRRIDQAQQLIVERGASEHDALNTLTVDLGRHVQRRQDAEEIADFVWSRVQTPGYRVDNVRVVPDWTRHPGQVIYIAHGRSGLASKALVAKVHRTGEAGKARQHLDLVLLVPTWADFAAVWAGRTWHEFAGFWTGRADNEWSAFADDPLLTIGA